MGRTNVAQARAYELELGHLKGRWTPLGEALGTRAVGVRRIELSAGGWSTPAHEHGRSEEIFYVLSGSGVAWHDGATFEVRAGDGILFSPRSGAHTLRADQTLDVLAFGTREYDESVAFPRLNLSLLNGRAAPSQPGALEGAPLQYLREAEHGPPPMPEQPGPRPAIVIALGALDPVRVQRPRVDRTRRNFGRAFGSETSGLQHVEVAAGMESTAQHCHSIEEEIFFVLAGDGALILDDEESPIGAGDVIARPPSTGVSHVFRAGESGLTYLAYSNRDMGDICYYRRSNKIGFRGVHVLARLERLEYWDGED